MLFTIAGKHVGITETVKRYAEEKTSKFPKYYSGINQVEVIINGEPSSKTSVEIIAKGEHSKIFVVTETDVDIYRCIDAAVHKLEEQLRRRKSKERDNKHMDGREPS
ncbi:MAG: ribosome-associated translation inhibitor RaiA [Sedimentisphaerales bacterium]